MVTLNLFSTDIQLKFSFAKICCGVISGAGVLGSEKTVPQSITSERALEGQMFVCQIITIIPESVNLALTHFLA